MVGVKISSVPNFVLKSPNISFLQVHKELLEHLFQILLETFLFITTFLLSCSMCGVRFSVSVHTVPDARPALVPP